MLYGGGSGNAGHRIRAKNFFLPSWDVLHVGLRVCTAIVNIIERRPRLGCWEIISQKLAEDHLKVVACGDVSECLPLGRGSQATRELLLEYQAPNRGTIM